MDKLLNYLSTSNVVDNIIYTFIAIILLIVLIFALVFIKKLGIWDMFLQVLREFGLLKNSSPPPSPPKAEEPKAAPPPAPVQQQPIVQQPVIENKGITAKEMGELIKSLNLDKESDKHLNNLHKEKIHLAEKITEYQIEIKDVKSKLQTREKQLIKMNQENKLLKDKLNIINKELEILKLTNHPDVLVFEKCLTFVGSTINGFFREIIVRSHLSQMNPDRYIIYRKKTANELLEKIKDVLRSRYDGTIITNLDHLFFNVTKDIDSDNNLSHNFLESIFIETIDYLRDFSLDAHDESEKLYRVNTNDLEVAMEKYLKETATKVIYFLKTRVVTNITVSEIKKNCLNRDMLFDIIIDNEMKVSQNMIKLKFFSQSTQFKLADSTIEKIIIYMEDTFKDHMVKKVMKAMENDKNKDKNQ